MFNRTRLICALLVVALSCVTVLADVKDSSDHKVVSGCIEGKVTAVTSENGAVSEFTVTDGSGSEFTVDGMGNDSRYFDQLEKAMDNDNNVTIKTDSSGRIEKLTRSVDDSDGGASEAPGTSTGASGLPGV